MAFFKFKKTNSGSGKPVVVIPVDSSTGNVGGRDQATLEKLMERLKKWSVKLYCTDHWSVYSKVIEEDKLKQGKAETPAIERNNCRQRHWLARFKRKSLVVSKSLQMVDLSMSLFARFRVNGDIEEISSLLC